MISPSANPSRPLNQLKARIVNWCARNRVFTLHPEQAPQARVLLSYLAYAENLKEAQKSHSSYWECAQMARTWRDLGCEVEVIAHGNTRFVPRHAYDVCIDIHSNLERLAPFLPPHCTKILHATGAHWIYQNTAEYTRLLALQERRGLTLQPRRIAPPSLGIECCDHATYLGNDFTASTFAFAAKPMTRIPLSTHFRAPWPQNKNWDASRFHFLWMASTGAVLRGLDVVLEAFAAKPHLQLHICGNVAGETDFFAAYRREMTQCSNIFYHGSIDLDSPLFERISQSCATIIYPSASEGGAGSVISAAHAALIPIVPLSSSVDTGNGALCLPDISVEAVLEAVETAMSWSPEEVETRARSVWEWANSHHTREIFAAHYEEWARGILHGQSSF